MKYGPGALRNRRADGPGESAVVRTYSLRERLGTLLYDWPRFLRGMAERDGWVRMRNRTDRVSLAPDGRGVACEWEYTRTLHLCDVFPFAGRWLLRRALKTDPIDLKAEPEQIGPDQVCWNGSVADSTAHGPEVAFVIGHRGQDRLPHLLAVLRTLAAQTGVRFECLVVEQDVTPVIRDALPRWVKHIHTPIPPELPYCRSWAFNVGAAQARAPLLVFHDNDMLVPERYAAALLERFRCGWEVIQLKRFVFYLAESSGPVEALRDRPEAVRVASVVQNLEGGGSVAVGREAFEAIGGFDEEFVGWGGEDNEFWDRCLTRRAWRFGEMPLVHLWHAAQPGKRAMEGMGGQTASLSRRKRALPPEDRIRALRSRRQGSPDRPPGSAAAPEPAPADRHRRELLARGYCGCEQVHSQHNARWKTYWRLERSDGLTCFAKVNHGYEDAAVNVAMGRKEALLAGYFREFLDQAPGWEVPRIVDHWESACGYFVVSEWLDMKPLPLVSILESPEWTGRLADLLRLLDTIPRPAFWSAGMERHDYACTSSFPPEGDATAPFGFDLDDNLFRMDGAGTLVLQDFEFIQWAARGLQGTHIALKCLCGFRKHLAKALHPGSAVRRLAATVPQPRRRARLDQAAKVLEQSLKRGHRWTPGARLRLAMARRWL